MAQSSIRSFLLSILVAMFILFGGVSLILISSHRHTMTYAHGQEVLYRLVTGSYVVERNDDAASFVAAYETQSYNPQLVTVTSVGDKINATAAMGSSVLFPRKGKGFAKATLFSNISKAFITLSDLSREGGSENSCPDLGLLAGASVTVISMALLLLIVLVSNYVSVLQRILGAVLGYGAVVVVPPVMMIALIAVISDVHTQCERFERGEQLRMTAEFYADLYNTYSEVSGKTTEAVVEEMKTFVAAVNAYQHVPSEGGFNRAILLVQGGSIKGRGIVAGSGLSPRASKLLVNLGKTRNSFHIINDNEFTGLVAKAYHPRTGLWLVLQEELTSSSNPLSHSHDRGGLIVGIVGAVVLSCVAALTLPFPSFGVTKGHQLGMAPTIDVSPVWPVSKALSLTIIGLAIAIGVMTNLGLSHRVTKYYDHSRRALRPLLGAYTNLQGVSVNTAMIVANASLGQEWDSGYEYFPSAFINETTRAALLEEQQTIRAITADYIDRYGPLGVYQAGYGTTYPPFLETSAARTFIGTLGSSSAVSTATIYMNRAEFAFLTLLLTQDMSYEAEMLYWLGLIVGEGIGSSSAGTALVTALTTLTLPVRTAVSQVSLTDARSHISLLSSTGAITNKTHSIYLGMLQLASVPVTEARTVIRSEMSVPSSELCFYFIEVGNALACTIIVMVGLVAAFDTWYTPTFLARRRSGGVYVTIGLIAVVCALGIAAVLGSSAALTADIASTTSAAENARRAFELVPRSLRLLDTAARSLAEWLIVLQLPTALSLNHAMSIDGTLRYVLQAFMEAVPDASDSRVQFILDLTSDLGDTLNSIFAVVARDYRDPSLPLADVAGAMDTLYRTANSTLLAGTAAHNPVCGCVTSVQAESASATVLEMARSVILRSASLWALPSASACCSQSARAVNQLYRRAMVYMQVEAIDEGALTTTDMATLTMRATNLLSKLLREIAGFQNNIITEKSIQTHEWTVGYWLPIVTSWVIAVVGGFILKFTGHELDAATK